MPPTDSPTASHRAEEHFPSAATMIRHPLLWVPTLYLAMGIPNATVSQVAAIMYKNLGVPVEKIALYTGLMYLPWVLKPLWSPFMEPFKTKRYWVIAMEFMMAVAVVLVGFALKMPSYFTLTIGLFWIIGFASGTQDIAADAVYMTSLSSKVQAQYAGIQGMCWNAGAILASGLLVVLTGKMHNVFHIDWVNSWMVVMMVIAATLAACGLWHLRVLPAGEPSSLHGGSLKDAFLSLRETWSTFFKKKQIWLMLWVVFMYRFAEGFIEKFGPLFLLDDRANGGLGLSNEALGSINSILGTIGFIVGALLGGFLAAKLTLRRSFVILALALNVPHVTYYLLSTWMPDNLALISVVVTIEKFGFGLGSVGHMLYMMQQLAPGPFKMSHYAFATGVMALSKWATGSISGVVYTALGHSYHTFFIFVLIASIPPVLTCWFAPFPQKDDQPAPGAIGGH
jgi:PAT family beta-lactamase induction signal transducer AmpG